MTEFETMEKTEELDNAIIVVTETEKKEGWSRKEKLLCAAACTFGADILISIGSYVFTRIKLKKMLNEIEECSDETAEENE